MHKRHKVKSAKYNKAISLYISYIALSELKIRRGLFHVCILKPLIMVFK
jgi:hypothetical protein